jgi:hypothetical protein
MGASDTTAGFDLRSLPDGPYAIDEDPGGGSVATAQLYRSADLRDGGSWGILDLKIDAGFYAIPAAFTIKLAAREEPLKYYVVAANFSQGEFDQLSVADNGYMDDGRPQVTFTKVLPALFTSDDISPDLLGDGSGRVVMFRSLTPVARRQRGSRKIQLTRNGDVLVENLSQPGPNRPRSDFIVHLSKI